MTLYEEMTDTIESITESAILIENLSGKRSDIVRGMLSGAIMQRDNLTIEAAEVVVF